jgi:hypothetical protein
MPSNGPGWAFGRRFWRAQRGQSTAFVATMMFVMILFVATVADVGQAVNRKVALQVLADTGAFTGASKMAVHMNQFAYWNVWLQRMWATFSWVQIVSGAFSVGFFWPGSPNSCSTSSSLDSFYNNAWKAVSVGTIEAPNVIAQPLPFIEALGVTRDYNALDLFPGETLQYTEYLISASDAWTAIPPQRPSPLNPMMWSLNLVRLQEATSGWPAAASWAARGAQSSYWFACDNYIPPFEYWWSVYPHTYHTWWQKADSQPYHFVWVVRAPPTRALMFDGFFSRFFGTSLIPEMTAAAAAKPVGGDINRGESRYVAKMVPMTDLNWFFPAVRDPLYTRLGGLRAVTH